MHVRYYSYYQQLSLFFELLYNCFGYCCMFKDTICVTIVEIKKINANNMDGSMMDVVFVLRVWGWMMANSKLEETMLMMKNNPGMCSWYLSEFVSMVIVAHKLHLPQIQYYSIDHISYAILSNFNMG